VSVEIQEVDTDVTFYYERIRIGDLLDHFDLDELKGSKLKGQPDETLLHAFARSKGFLLDSTGNRTSYFKDEDNISPVGGSVICIIDVDGIDYVGISWCSLSDTFNYKIGRSIAYGRALKKLESAIVAVEH
jgi:hypothetical protein